MVRKFFWVVLFGGFVWLSGGSVLGQTSTLVWLTSAAHKVWVLAGSAPAQTAGAAEVGIDNHFNLYFDNARHISSADSTLNATRDKLKGLLSSDLEFVAEVYLVESLPRFDSLVGSKFPDWGVAAAIPHWKRIVIKSPDSFRLNRPLGELLAHEYSHLALAYRTGRRRVPRWLDEGMAMMVSMEWSWGDNLTMNLAAVLGDFIPLEEIDRVNRFGEQRAHLAYAQSYMAVQYIFGHYGIEGMTILLDSLAAEASLDSALMASTGSNKADFEAEFSVYLQEKYNFIGLVSDTMYFWLVLAIILVLGGVLSYRRRRMYLQKWEEEERLASTDFDYGDPDAPEKLDDDDSEPWRQ